MPSQSPFRIEPTEEQRAVLDERARAHTAPSYWEVVRARIVLLAAEGTSNKEISLLDWTPLPRRSASGASAFTRKVCPDWRIGPARAGPRPFPPSVRVEVKAIACCELPFRSGVPLSRWSAAEVVAREVVERGAL